MSSRITKVNLESVVRRINTLTSSPQETYVKQLDGRFVAQIGNYHLDDAYGGWALHRIVNESGAVSDVLGVGHVSKPELYRLLHSFIRGLEARDDHG
jgi:hypothetical protein